MTDVKIAHDTPPSPPRMTFADALKRLRIEEYGDRIFNSNSHGELFHIYDYIQLADSIQSDEQAAAFREWFVAIVEWTAQNWKRPELVYQHIPRLLEETTRTR